MPRTFWLFAFLLFVGGGALACTADTDGAEAGHDAEEPELAQYMMRLQHWSHKATLALEARNAELAEFYLHEMEETIETIQAEAPTYEDQPVGDLTEDMLVPAVESLDGALEDRRWSAVDTRVQEVAHACNQCHATTGYDFIQINLRDVPNPYAQSFDTTSTP